MRRTRLSLELEQHKQQHKNIFTCRYFEWSRSSPVVVATDPARERTTRTTAASGGVEVSSSHSISIAGDRVSFTWTKRRRLYQEHFNEYSMVELLNTRKRTLVPNTNTRSARASLRVAPSRITAALRQCLHRPCKATRARVNESILVKIPMEMIMPTLALTSLSYWKVKFTAQNTPSLCVITSPPAWQSSRSGVW